IEKRRGAATRVITNIVHTLWATALENREIGGGETGHHGARGIGHRSIDRKLLDGARLRWCRLRKKQRGGREREQSRSNSGSQSTIVVQCRCGCVTVPALTPTVPPMRWRDG